MTPQKPKEKRPPGEDGR